MVALQFSERIRPALTMQRLLLHKWSPGLFGQLCSTNGRLLHYTAGRAYALASDDPNYTTRTS